MKTFLHVGCGPKRKDSTTALFSTAEWDEIRVDIDAAAAPDWVGSMTDMHGIADASVDAVFSCHNLEHLYAHEVLPALAEFRRVLRPDGHVVVTVPDLQSVCALVAADRLTEAAYTSPAGDIAPIDMIYGHRASLAGGNAFMAHRCGFTLKVLFASFKAAGFASVVGRRREAPHFDLWALATVTVADDALVRGLATAHFPG